MGTARRGGSLDVPVEIVVHGDAGPAITSYAREKVSRITRFVGRIWLTQIGCSVPPYEQLVDAVAGVCARRPPAYDGLQLAIPPRS